MNKTTTILTECPLLQGFPANALEDLAAIGRLKTFCAGQQIYEQGAKNTSLCIIAEGVVRISAINLAGRESTLIMLNAGAWFGDSVFSPGNPRVYGATAHENVALMELPGDAFRALMGRYPESYPVALDMVSRRLYAAMSIIEDDSLRDLPTRIGRRLLFLAQMQGNGEAGEAPVTVSITREQIANMMGMTRQGVHKWIKAFEREGYIRLAYGSITINNPSKLLVSLKTDSVSVL